MVSWFVMYLRTKMSVKFYRVGGSVRDQFLGIPSKDIDYAVEAKSFEEMRDVLLERGYKIFLETPEYLTIRARHPESKMTADFALCQSTKGKIGTILEDLGRRDFTVNAIAIDEDDNIIDPYNGQGDLNLRILRGVISAEDRIREDPLRALRALRFRLTKKLFFEGEILQILKSDWLPKALMEIPTERIRQELQSLFKYDTLETLDLIHTLPNELKQVIFSEVWLVPTVKKKKGH